MKLGCCINMAGSKEEPIGRRCLPVLKAAGYDYAELPLAQVMELPEEDFESLLEELRAAAIPCLCCNNFFPADVRLTGDAVDLEKVGTYVRESLGRAARLGAEKIVFGSGGAKNVPEGFPHDEAFKQIVQTLKLVDVYAKQYGIEIVIEPLNHMESNIILNLSDGKRLMDAGDYENIFLLVDYYHYVKENDSPEVLKKCMKDIRHVHFAEPEGRGFPVEIKEEYREFFDLLKEGGYDGTVSIEANSAEPEADIGRAVFMRELL